MLTKKNAAIISVRQWFNTSAHTHIECVSFVFTIMARIVARLRSRPSIGILFGNNQPFFNDVEKYLIVSMS